jgi:hypothetical protein
MLQQLNAPTYVRLAIYGREFCLKYQLRSPILRQLHLQLKHWCYTFLACVFNKLEKNVFVFKTHYPTCGVVNLPTSASCHTGFAFQVRTDLISAMKLPDSEPLTADDYWIVTDTWKQVKRSSKLLSFISCHGSCCQLETWSCRRQAFSFRNSLKWKKTP